MVTLCCRKGPCVEEGNEVAYLVCSQCGKPCDRVVIDVLSETLTDESL